MRACMTCSTNTTSTCTMGGVGMSTSDCRPTESSAGCTTTSSESFLSSTFHTDPVPSSSLALTLHPLTGLTPSPPHWSHLLTGLTSSLVSPPHWSHLLTGLTPSLVSSPHWSLPLTGLTPSLVSPLPPTRLIVIAEKKTVYEKFPTPLINRLEKHFVLTSSVLTEEQQDVLHQFQEWIQQFASVSRTSE